MVGGGSDANFTSELTATLDGLGAVGDGAHALDEHVVLQSLPERAALLALLLLEPAGIAYPNATLIREPGLSRTSRQITPQAGAA